MPMAISSLVGLIDTWNNEDMSFGEKMLTTFTTLAMVIPTLTTALATDTAASIANWIAKKALAAAGVEEAAMGGVVTALKEGETVATVVNTTSIWGQVAAKIADLAVSWPLLAVTLLLVAAMAALAVVIIAVAKVAKTISDNYNADAIAA